MSKSTTFRVKTVQKSEPQMDVFEQILRKHFQLINKDGLGFLENNIQNALKDLRNQIPIGFANREINVQNRRFL